MISILEPSRQARHSRKKQAEEAEIGPPKITDEQRAIGDELREACWDDLEAFNVRVFPNSTGLKPLGEVQRDSIAHDQSVIIGGGKVCKGEPRAYGKTTRTCNAAMWAVLTGRRRMVPIFSANMEKSKSQVMARWKVEISRNDYLFFTFPELIWPLRALQNKPQRCASQTMNGEPTRTQWTADRIVFPHVPGVPGSGSALIALPLKSCRGATHTTPDGTVLRPELCIFDDVQKDEDADNPNTINKIEELIDHTAMMLGGHSQSMSSIMNCTVRRLDDLSEKYLKKSSWRRVRYKMLKARSTGEELHWLGRYAEIRRAYDPESPEDQERAHRDSLAYYLANRAAMDDGAVVTWDWAYAWSDKDPTEVSAVQHAYNILIDLGESVFASECQNEPLEDKSEATQLKPAQVLTKAVKLPKGILPQFATHLTAFIDVQDSILYYAVCAWGTGFRGHVVDYGAYPDQGKAYFGHRDVRRTLAAALPGSNREAWLRAGLNTLVNQLVERKWRREDGAELTLNLIMADAGDGDHADVVYEFCRRSPHSALLKPSKGRYVGAASVPWELYPKRTGETQGHHWLVALLPKSPATRLTHFDTNYWKTFVVNRISSPVGDRAGLELFEGEHRMLADHMTAEYGVRTEGRGRVLTEFKLRPNRDNHYFDCVTGCAVAASIVGVQMETVSSVQPRKIVKWSEVQRARRLA